MDYTVYEILQARILEWVAIPFSRVMGLNPCLPHCRWILYQLSHKESPGILECVAYPFSSRSSWPRNQTRVSCTAGGFFTSWATKEALEEIREGNLNRKLSENWRRYSPGGSQLLTETLAQLEEMPQPPFPRVLWGSRWCLSLAEPISIQLALSLEDPVHRGQPHTTQSQAGKRKQIWRAKQRMWKSVRILDKFISLTFSFTSI